MKSRFCPSPTGHMHLGNTRTALFNALVSRKEKGVFLLRIEDTDQSRSTEEYSVVLQEDLKWLGLDWQEGPGEEKESGPYFQSQRQSIYDKYYAELEKNNRAYPCFCSDAELAMNRKIQVASKQAPRYPGTCQKLTEDKVQEKLSQGLKPTLRFRMPENEPIEFDDLVRGKQKFNSSDIGDFIIRRADGTASFMYCNAVDDALMGVTHALRGEDHITNTPRQIIILKTLGLTAPSYGHLPLITSPNGGPLAKREGSRSILEMRLEGFLPEAINNYLARLGHSFESNEFMSLDDLAKHFSINNIGRAPAKFDPKQLLYWQKQAISHASNEIVWSWLGKGAHELIPADKKESFVETIRGNIEFPADAMTWVDTFFNDLPAFSTDQEAILKDAGKKYFEVAQNAFDQYGADYKLVNNFIAKEMDVKGRALFQPLRIALTGQMHGPEMVSVVELLGIDKVNERIRTVYENI